MSKLEDFLNLPDVSEIQETIKEVFNGNTFEFVIRPLSEEEHSEFQKRSNTISGKKMIFDLGKYNRLVLNACIIEPNFNDDNFLKKVKCATGSDYLNRKFPAGIVSDIAEKIQKLSGFEPLDAEVEEAKN